MRTAHPGSAKRLVQVSQTCVIYAALAVLVGFAANSQAWAQTAKKLVNRDIRENATDSAGRTQGKPVAVPGESPILYWIDKAGKPFPVLIGKPGQTLEQFLKQFNPPKSRAEQSPSEARVTRMVLSGAVQGDRATLEAAIVVQIVATDKIVAVPLRLAEATLIGDPVHTGPGQSFSGIPQKTGGLIWWFQGEGEHRLTLKLSVPITKRAPLSRIQLSLPQATFSELNLAVPHGPVSAKIQAQEGLSKPVITGIEGSEIKIAGLGTLLDLSWKPQTSSALSAPVLEVDNTILVNFDTGAVFIEARQQIRSIQGTGTFDTLRVELPKEARLLSLQGEAVDSHSPEASNPNVILVRLQEPTHGPIELKWDLEIENAAEEGNVAVEGFHVHGAVHESGLVGLKKEMGRRLDITREGMKFVRRVDIADVKKQFPEVLDAAFRFSKQPFHLQAAARKVEPQSTVSPKMVLTISEAGIHFEGIFAYRVVSGSIDAVVIHWPNWRKNGWTLQPHETDAVTTGRSEEGDHDIIYSLAEGAGGSFVVRLTADRPLSSGAGAIDFDLPEAKATRRRPAYVIVTMHDNVEVKSFKPDGETVARLLDAALPSSLQALVPAGDRPPIVYEVDSMPRRFTGVATIHVPLIQTSSVVKLSAANRKTTSVSQTISYTAAWGRLTTASLLVPDSVRDTVTFFSGSSSRPLTGIVSQETEQPGWKPLTLTLDKPRIGRFEIRAEYDVSNPLPTVIGREQPMTIPVIQPRDGNHVTTYFEASRTGTISARIGAEDWRSQTDAHGTPIWSTNRVVREIPIIVTRGGETDREDITVSKAYIRTVVGADGVAESIAHYLLTEAPARFDVTLPATVKRGTFAWDGDTLPDEQVIASASVPGLYTITVPTLPGEAQSVLTVRYRVSTGSPLNWNNALRLPAPRLADKTWISQSIWELVLPENQLLFTDPSGLTSHNRWRREGAGAVLWSRVPEQTSRELQRWIFGHNGPEPEFQPPSGNRYQFSRFGPVQQMSFQTMSWPMVVGIGSGLSLVLGLMFQYVPVVRNVLSILAIGFVTAVVGIRFTNAVLLLLQASGLGMALAIISSLIQGMIRRRRSAVVTVHPASGFLPGVGSSIDHEAVSAAGSQHAKIAPESSELKSGLISSSTVTGAAQ